MTKKKKIAIFIVLALFVSAPLIIYLIHFCGQSLSDDTETWGQFGDYLNGTFMPIIALVGIIVTFLLGLISDRRNESNLKIEQQKQRPLLYLHYYDSEETLKICLYNKGNGPLIITNYRLVNLRTEQEKSSIFSILPEIDRHYDDYTGNQNNRVLIAGEEMLLFLYNTSANDEENKRLIRQALSQYKVVVDYKDVYDNQMPTYERSLDWFGRNIQQSKTKSSR